MHVVFHAAAHKRRTVDGGKIRQAIFTNTWNKNLAGFSVCV
jgi:FlaA1/EpsC-like NDP-sugar epimerase